MDDAKRDLPYPFNQDFSGVLRCQLPNSVETAAMLDAAVSLVRRNLGPGAERTMADFADADSVDRPVLRFISQQAVVDEVNRNGRFSRRVTANTLRYRWPCMGDFYADLLRFGQWELHYPGAHQDDIADATEQIIHGEDPVPAIHRLCDWAVKMRVGTPMFRLGGLAAVQAEGDPPIQAAIAEHHVRNEAAWDQYCVEFLKARHLKLRPGITLRMCVTLITALADGLTMRAITETDPATSRVIDYEAGRCLLSTGVLALIASCAEPEDQPGGQSLEEAAAALMERNSS
jgi:hypothetical protein